MGEAKRRGDYRERVEQSICRKAADVERAIVAARQAEVLRVEAMALEVLVRAAAGEAVYCLHYRRKARKHGTLMPVLLATALSAGWF